MADINIKQSDVEAAFNELKSRTGELNTTDSGVTFDQSKLDFINKIESMESTYYQLINQYKTFLLRVEEAATSSISDFIEYEKSLGGKMIK
ncbi:DUF5344 family protein [Bacillus carboniphilus]|uniref:DUF5344 family protein n=1 Tax=Bacillus carboniphilus TaxID=86663 RepID=A0ABY9JWF1_9BACI|nr:DUF5344 family protein [Bacillus carboniphilus]WLR42812.1 DUF5344 family protein [Bacillus carboniphilus]